jgi:hypothetical protein
MYLFPANRAGVAEWFHPSLILPRRRRESCARTQMAGSLISPRRVVNPLRLLFRNVDVMRGHVAMSILMLFLCFIGPRWKPVHLSGPPECDPWHSGASHGESNVPCFNATHYWQCNPFQVGEFAEVGGRIFLIKKRSAKPDQLFARRASARLTRSNRFTTLRPQFLRKEPKRNNYAPESC